MKRLVLTDGLIREALSPDPHATAPASLLAQVAAEVARTPQRRTLHLPALPQSRRLAWVLVGAATLLLLLGALVFGGGSRNPLEAFLPPVPSPLPQQLPVPMTPMAVEIEAISAEEAWASVGGGDLWHRTAAGWTGPFDPLDAPREDLVRDLAHMPDGRIVVSTDLGILVGDEQGWTRLAPFGGGGVAVDAKGVIWTGSMGSERGLRAYREVDGAWQAEFHPCGAGGFLVAASADGSVWTAGIDYTGTAGVARLEGGTCSEVQPWGDGTTHEAMALATGDGGTVAVRILGVQDGDVYTDGRIMAWNGDQWTTLHGGTAVVSGGWSGLAYGPGGTLWAAFDGRLWRYVNGAGSIARDNVGAGPVSVAPDGSVWFVTQDPDTGDAFVDRLVPADGAALATPAPQASSPLRRPRVGLNGAAEIVPISADEAWASDESDGVWHRTAAGWAGPFVMAPSGSTQDRAIRGLARMPDGRIVVSADNGLWVGNEQAWTKVTSSASTGVAVDTQGVIWTSHGGRTLRSYRQAGDNWQSEVHSCGAGGWVVAASGDGSTWTAGIAYSGTGGIARVASGTCTEVKPWGDGVTHEVMSIAASAGGAVATSIFDLPQGDDYASARIMTWDGHRWTTLREGEALVGAGWNRLSYAPDGSLWAAFDGRLWRYVDGTESSIRTGVAAGPVAVAADGAVWFAAVDPETGAAFFDRLLPAGDTTRATPAPTASPHVELTTDGG